jgi:hypothetical protein
MISRNIDVVVTSVLQTTAGKMIFGRFVENAAPQPVQAPAHVTGPSLQAGRAQGGK